ncbi:hypothetical protein T11_589 [Trichinella zimbabwensis]|uniref:Uncharacterized protein n=1 Tax=Trichinella zimbabwensis TaxID=268475 RepID=A0A0V1I3J0_9BILA|nr:hypothetical protein T11_589 [Trichinella zimbabwensis]
MRQMGKTTRKRFKVRDSNHPKVKEKSLTEMSETENERKWMKDRKLSVGDTVLWRIYGTGPRWMPGTVAQVRDPSDSMVTREEVPSEGGEAILNIDNTETESFEEEEELIEESTILLNRSNRIRKKPKYLDDFLVKV